MEERLRAAILFHSVDRKVSNDEALFIGRSSDTCLSFNHRSPAARRMRLNSTGPAIRPIPLLQVIRAIRKLIYMHSKVVQNLADFSEFYVEAQKSFGRLPIPHPPLCTVATFDLHSNRQNRFALEVLRDKLPTKKQESYNKAGGESQRRGRERQRKLVLICSYCYK